VQHDIGEGTYVDASKLTFDEWLDRPDERVQLDPSALVEVVRDDAGV
jgi:hypothetical protein